MKTHAHLALATLLLTATPAATLPAADSLPTLAEKASKAKTLEGTFIRIDEGDYFHWVMKTATGDERTFFILKPDASVDKVIEAPESHVGKKCRITWDSGKEDIPEAGGKIDIEQILSVEWLGKK